MNTFMSAAVCPPLSPLGQRSPLLQRCACRKLLPTHACCYLPTATICCNAPLQPPSCNRFLQLVIAHSGRKFGDLKSQEAANLLWALAKAEHPPPQDWLQAFVSGPLTQVRWCMQQTHAKLLRYTTVVARALQQ